MKIAPPLSRCRRGEPAARVAPAAFDKRPIIERNSTAGLGTRILNGVQTGLDVVGLIPGAGEIADGANAMLSLGRGDYKGAALSAAAMIPFAGWGATGAKAALKYGDEALALARQASKVDPAQLRRLTIDAERAKKDFLTGTGLRPGNYNIGKGADGTFVLIPVQKGGNPVPTGVK